ncbi:MAG: prolipoprotein diacylglyceryl transferase [Tepidisphaeraceae bacterium]|jgi:phosphatidylglycerol:prolipoprotein diacylglycerol transferase
MLQEVFRLHLFGREIPIYGYGLMLVVAYLACVKSGQWLGKYAGIRAELFSGAAAIAMVTGIIGARLCHILENFPQYSRSDLTVWKNLANMANTREGGLTFYGGFLLATPCCILYAIKNKIPVLLGMDIVAPVLMIGLGIGRIGCFMNGCCYGERCDHLPWAVRFPYDSNAYVEQFEKRQLVPPAPLIRRGEDGTISLLPADGPEIAGDPDLQSLAAASRALPVHPAEIYSAITAFLLAAVLISYFTLPHIDGRVFALMLILEGFGRFVLEIIRVEPPVWQLHIGPHSFGWSTSMILGLLNCLGGIVLWWVLPLRPAKIATSV